MPFGPFGEPAHVGLAVSHPAGRRLDLGRGRLATDRRVAIVEHLEASALGSARAWLGNTLMPLLADTREPPVGSVVAVFWLAIGSPPQAAVSSSEAVAEHRASCIDSRLAVLPRQRETLRGSRIRP